MKTGYFWTTGSIGTLIALARRGEPWDFIAAQYYPDAAKRRSTVCEIFRRYATRDDVAARSAAIRTRNWNRVPGLSARADRRRRARLRQQKQPDEAVTLPELRSPFAGNCFQ